MGNISSEHQEVCHANFAAYTYFEKHQAETVFQPDVLQSKCKQSLTEKINPTLKQFWEIEDVHSPNGVPINCMEEQLPMKRVENMLLFENHMHSAALPDNYELTLSR